MFALCHDHMKNTYWLDRKALKEKSHRTKPGHPHHPNQDHPRSANSQLPTKVSKALANHPTTTCDQNIYCMQMMFLSCLLCNNTIATAN